MIVWGGIPSSQISNTGGRYNPALDQWLPTSTGANVPSARYGHAAVWTGTEMIVWGADPFGTGGRYDPALDHWLPTSTGANLPTNFGGTSAVWTGTEMIIWGGSASGGGLTNGGGRYDPSLDQWMPTSTGAGVPEARGSHSAVWTGTEMIVWGGQVYNAGTGYTSVTTGGRYDPSTDTWIPTSTGASVPSARRLHTAVWTGSEMIVWGGNDGHATLSTGGRYDPLTDAWSATSAGPTLPLIGFSHAAVWTAAYQGRDRTIAHSLEERLSRMR
jgi:hypothetical protein